MEIIIKRCIGPWLKPFTVSVMTLALASCNGDVRPLEEQIEAIDLDLASIEISLPPNSLTPFFISSEQPIQLGIIGTSNAGDSIFLSSDDRRWTSTNPNVVSINSDGVAVGRAEGSADVSISVAGILALEPLTINVSNAPLLSIAAITGGSDTAVITNPMLDPCIPILYSAIGDFGGSDMRRLDAVVWTIDEASEMVNAELFTTAATANGSTQLVGRTPTGTGLAGPITLTATVPADAETGTASLSASRIIEVADSLLSLTIDPPMATILEDGSIRLTAMAEYSTVMNSFATNGADWEVTMGELVASVGTVGGSPGQVTGDDLGTATVTARCGSFEPTAIITVAAGSEDLVFNRTSDLILELDDPEFNDLRVAQGVVFDVSNEVTGEAEWSSSDTAVVTVDNTGDDRGDLLAIGVGTAIITAEFGVSSLSINVEVR